MTVAIDHDLRQQAFIRHAIPDPIVKPATWTDVVMLAGDEIAQDMGAFVVGEAEVTEKHFTRNGRQPVLGDQSSPGEIAGVGRPHGRPKLLTHDGVSAVGADQDLARFYGSIVEY